MATTVYIRPSADVTLNHSCNTGSVGYNLINEATADGDSTYIYQTINSTSETSKESTFTVSGNIGTNKKIKSATLVANAKATTTGTTTRTFVITCGSNSSSNSLTNSYKDFSVAIDTSNITYNSSTGEASATIILKTSGRKQQSKVDDFYLRITQAYISLSVEDIYTVTAGAMSNGTVYVGTSSNPSTTSCTATNSDTVYVKSVPSTGYQLSSWSTSNGTASSTGSTAGTITSLTANATVTGSFSIINYNVTGGNVTGGIVYVGTSSSPTTTACTANITQTVYVKVVASDGYSFNSWSISSGTGTPSGTGSTTGTITTVKSNISVTASLTAISRTITGGEVTGGYVYVGTSSNPSTTSCTANITQTVYVRCVAKDGYSFSSWSISGTGTASGTGSTTGTITAIKSNITVSGTFGINTYNITGGNVTGGIVYVGTASNPTTTACTANITQTVYVKVTANDGYSFNSWSISGTGTASGTGSTTGTITTIKSNVSVTASLTAISRTITGGDFTGGYIYVGTSSNPSTTSCTANITQTVYIKCVAKTGYGFTSWSISGTGTASGTGSTTGTITAIKSNITVSGVFPIQTYTVSVGSVSNGSVTLSKSQTGTYTTSVTATILETVYVKCAPNTGYQFNSWATTNGTASGTGSTAGTITAISGNATVTGSFSLINRTIAGGNVTGGIVYVGTSSNPSSTSCTATYNDTIYVKVSVSAGYTFIKWSISSGTGTAANTGSTTGTITKPLSNINVTATININTYTITGAQTDSGNTYVGKTATATTTSCTATILDTIYVNCVAGKRYAFNSWSKTGTATATGTSLSSGGTLTNISSNVSVSSSFSIDTTIIDTEISKKGIVRAREINETGSGMELLLKKINMENIIEI